MKIGLVLPQGNNEQAAEVPRARDVLEFGRAAEAIGIDSLWLTDHFYFEPYLDFLDHGYQLPEEQKGVRGGYWECWTMLAALATKTERVEIGTLVTNTAFRNPALLANMAETVDALSGGRLVLGLGAGDFRSEHTFHGYPWDRRVSRFEEALEIIAPLLDGERVTFEGEFYQTRDARMFPKGPRAHGPPILIGMMQGGPRMRRLAAQYADGWSNWIAFEDSRAASYAPRIEPMLDTAEQYGRDPATMRRHVTVGVKAPDAEFMAPGATPITGSPAEIIGEIQQFAELGVDHLTIFLQPYSEDGLAWLAEVLDQVRLPA